MCDVVDRIGEQRQMFADDGRLADLRMRGECADVYMAVFHLNACQRRGLFTEAADIDQQFRRRQAHVQRGHQALAAGEDFGMVVVFVK